MKLKNLLSHGAAPEWLADLSDIITDKNPQPEDSHPIMPSPATTSMTGQTVCQYRTGLSI